MSHSNGPLVFIYGLEALMAGLDVTALSSSAKWDDGFAFIQKKMHTFFRGTMKRLRIRSANNLQDDDFGLMTLPLSFSGAHCRRFST